MGLKVVNDHSTYCSRVSILACGGPDEQARAVSEDVVHIPVDSLSRLCSKLQPWVDGQKRQSVAGLPKGANADLHICSTGTPTSRHPIWWIHRMKPPTTSETINSIGNDGSRRHIRASIDTG